MNSTKFKSMMPSLTVGKKRGIPAQEFLVPRAKEPRVEDARINPSETRATGNWQYLHEYIKASTIDQETGLLGSAPQEVASAYPVGSVQDRLDQRGSDGWQLVSMEPHWYWERVFISLAMSITKPLAIVGWYLTFTKARA